MEDRELLEFAAKAAGLEYRTTDDHVRLLVKGSDNLRRPWNPLEDDGDAFRLASSLDICLRLMGDELTGIARWHKNGKTNRVVGSYHTGNHKEARILVVRAAAEIGKSMP